MRLTLSPIQRYYTRLLVGLLTIFPCALATTQTLDQTSVGRFGVGHTITPNSATQDLIAWHVTNTGRDLHLQMYDPDDNLLSLAHCGLPGDAAATAGATIHDIGWTQLSVRYQSAGHSVEVLESLLTPAVWFRSTGHEIDLFRTETGDSAPAVVEGFAVPLAGGVRFFHSETGYDAVDDGTLIKPWILALVRSGEYRYPVICLLQNQPSSIRFGAKGDLAIEWSGVGAVGLFPLYGCRPMPLAQTAGWGQALPAGVERQIDRLARWFLQIPAGVHEDYRIERTQVVITNTITFQKTRDDWGWVREAKGWAPIPSALVNAADLKYPIAFDGPVIDTDYEGFLSHVRLMDGTSTLVYRLPVPRLYDTLYSPYVDPKLLPYLPPAVGKTVADYSRYVETTYRGKMGEQYDNSAIGEARSLSSDYPSIRMMSPAARATFERWADRAAQELYSLKKCYGYGTEAANHRRFLLDNYRLGDHDFMDAGWFGYDVMAMWARAHYGGHWDEVKANWPWIRELFYGWNWSYSDYHAMFAPLYIDGTNGGNPKGYTDQMSMFPALYDWARMADHLGDHKTLNDALYMLARDRVARFNRMTECAYAKTCGFHTDTNYFTSDMWNGPNISPAGHYIPHDESPWINGDIVDYGPSAPGPWFLSGSFLEPCSPEVIDLMRTGAMLPHATQTIALFGERYLRWWAAPAVGEPANYQIYARGALLHEDPALLRYYFDYQNGFHQGVWWADAWHADAFAGIVLSPFRGLEDRGFIHVSEIRSRRSVAAEPEIETNLLIDMHGRKILTLWNRAETPIYVSIRLDLQGLEMAGATTLGDLKRGKPVHISADGVVDTVLAPGSNLLAFPSPTPPKFEVRVPSAIVAVAGSPCRVKFTLINHGAKTVRCRVGSLELQLAGPRAFPVPAGKSVELTGAYSPPAVCGMPTWITLLLEQDGKMRSYRTQALTLPSMVALMDVEGSKVVREPDVATATIVARSRMNQAASLHLTAALNGKPVADRQLAMNADSPGEWSVPLKSGSLPAGRYTLTVDLSGPGSAAQHSTSNILLLPRHGDQPSDPITLYGFESGIDGWSMPPWPDANHDEHGAQYAPTAVAAPGLAGMHALQVQVSIHSGKFSQAVVGVRPTSDWTPFRKVLVDVFLPASAPEGLAAHFYMMGDSWQWRESAVHVLLRPGQWTTVEVALDGRGVEGDWGKPLADIRKRLVNVLDFGLSLHNEGPHWSAYTGPVYVANFRAVAQ
jgi:hypothetical protein